MRAVSNGRCEQCGEPIIVAALAGSNKSIRLNLEPVDQGRRFALFVSPVSPVPIAKSEKWVRGYIEHVKTCEAQADETKRAKQAPATIAAGPLFDGIGA